jgi:hypothetical protein
MKNKGLHIAVKSIAMVLLIAIVLPSVVKFTHVFENHKHELCSNPSDTHYHEIEIDCEFYKFKLNTVYAIKTLASDVLIIENNHKIKASQYFYVSDFQRLPFSLRGPPNLI